MAVMSIKDYQDLYKEHVGTTFSSKDFIEQFDKAFRISSKKKKNKAEELAKSYEEALERAKEVLGKDSGSFNSVLENLTKYFDEKDNKDTDQTKIQKETAEEISELSKKVKKLKTNSEDLEKKLEEKGTDKSLGFFKRRKELKQLEKDLKKSKKIFLLCVSERKEAKAQALTEGVASKSTTMNLIYHEKNKQGIIGFLMQAKETLSKIEKEKDKNGKIKGYRDLSVKEYDNLIKALTSSTKKEFLSSCYDFEKIRENIYNSMKSKRRKSNDENDISDIILDVREKILKFVEINTIPTLKNITDHPEKVKELSIKYNSDVEKEKKVWLDYFPLGVRTSAKNFIEVCLGNASLGMNSISQRIQKTTKEYSKAAKALINGSFILSTSTIVASTTSGATSIAFLPVIALGITMVSYAIKNLVKSKDDLKIDNDVVKETSGRLIDEIKKKQEEMMSKKPKSTEPKNDETLVKTSSESSHSEDTQEQEQKQEHNPSNPSRSRKPLPKPPLPKPPLPKPPLPKSPLPKPPLPKPPLPKSPNNAKSSSAEAFTAASKIPLPPSPGSVPLPDPDSTTQEDKSPETTAAALSLDPDEFQELKTKTIQNVGVLISETQKALGAVHDIVFKNPQRNVNAIKTAFDTQTPVDNEIRKDAAKSILYFAPSLKVANLIKDAVQTALMIEKEANEGCSISNKNEKAAQSLAKELKNKGDELSGLCKKLEKNDEIFTKLFEFVNRADINQKLQKILGFMKKKKGFLSWFS